jgi:hypothetical protein
MDWQPIATCPREPNKPVVLLLSNGGPMIAEWNVDGWGEPVWDNYLNGEPYGLPLYYEPTHWMPLPDPLEMK